MPLQQTHRISPNLSSDPKFGRLLVISLVLHAAAVLVLGGYLQRAPKVESKPVYYVDLVHKPVLNPQAGRPDPRPVKQTKPAPPKPQPTKTVTPAKPKSKPKPAAKSPTKPVAKPVVKPKPVPQDTRSVQSAIEVLRAKQQRQAEIDALKDKLANLQQPAVVPAEVPIGMADGTGSDVGVSTQAFVQAYIQQNWALSPYLLADPSRMANIEAKVLLEYAADGRLVRFRVQEASGDSQFDDSIKKAITKSKQLPQPLPRRVEFVVVFNLKEMAQARR
jgi:outer membrane biosynthesis protein TonB